MEKSEKTERPKGVTKKLCLIGVEIFAWLAYLSMTSNIVLIATLHITGRITPNSNIIFVYMVLVLMIMAVIFLRSTVKKEIMLN